MNYSDAQLIDTLLGKKSEGTGLKLIAEYGDLFSVVQNIDAVPLTDRQRSILKAAVQIHFVREEKATFNSPADAAAMVSDLKLEIQENFVVLCLDRRNRLLRRVDLYKGSVSSSQVRIGEVFRMALILQASAVILVHNHPSGDPTPSPDDIALTRAVVQAGKLLDVDVLDHIVIGADKWVSLKERGLGF